MTALPKAPELIAIGEYWRYGLSVDATCRCGHTRNITAGMLVRIFGDSTSMSLVTKQRLAQKLRCTQCGAKRPTIDLVRKSG